MTTHPLFAPVFALATWTGGILAGCTTPDAVAPTLPQALQGVWCSPDERGDGCWAWDEFMPDGTLAMCGRHDGDGGTFDARAAVSFEGRRLCYRVIEARGDFWLRPGQRYCTEIVEVHRDRHLYRDLDTGQVFTLLRRPRRECPADAPDVPGRTAPRPPA